MTQREIEDNVPILLEHYEAVVRFVDQYPVQNADKRKVTRRRVIDLYAETGNVLETADECRITSTLVINILPRAVAHARQLHGLPPLARRAPRSR